MTLIMEMSCVRACFFQLIGEQAIGEEDLFNASFILLEILEFECSPQLIVE